MENDYIMVEVEPNKYTKVEATQVTTDDFEYTKESIAEAPFAKGLIKLLNEAEKKFEMKKGERGQTNMKIYKVKVIFIDNKEKIEIVSAEDELQAIDLVMEHYSSKNVLDIKII